MPPVGRHPTQHPVNVGAITSNGSNSWRPPVRRRVLGFLVMLPMSALVVGTLWLDDSEGGGGAIAFVIIFLLIFNGVALVQAFRDSVRVTDSELVVRTTFGRAKRVPRDRLRDIRVSRRAVDFVGVDELPFLTLDRGLYSDAQLREMAETLGISIHGPRRPRRLGRFEDSARRD